LSGTSIVIRAPHGDGHQWGVLLPDHDWCGDGSISFDVRLDTVSGMNGFAVLPEGIDRNGSPVGDATLFYRDTDGTFIAEYSKLPTPANGVVVTTPWQPTGAGPGGRPHGCGRTAAAGQRRSRPGVVLAHLRVVVGADDLGRVMRAHAERQLPRSDQRHYLAPRVVDQPPEGPGLGI
jgi:hypothetical protein